MDAASWLQSLLALAAVLALMAGAAWLARRTGLARAAPASPLRPVATVSVGARERVTVLELGETWIVVGVAPGRVSALHSMPRAPLPEAVADAPHPAFAAWLARARGAQG